MRTRSRKLLSPLEIYIWHTQMFEGDQCGNIIHKNRKKTTFDVQIQWKTDEESISCIKRRNARVEVGDQAK